MAGPSKTLWWLPGALLGAAGVVFLVGGFVSGGPDVVGGIVFAAVSLAAAGEMLHRRAPGRKDEG